MSLAYEQPQEQLENQLLDVPTVTEVDSGALVSANIYPTQFRTEHSRSLEDAERYKAISTLKELGVLLPASEVEIRHGRLSADSEGSAWSVNPAFRNGGNDSGNNNLYNRPVLYTSDEETALEFARERGVEEVRKRINQHLKDEVAATDPQVWRQAVLDAGVERERQKLSQLEGDERADYLDESFVRYIIGERYRRALLEELRTGQKTIASNEPWEDHEIRRAAREKEDALTKEQRSEIWKKYAAGLSASTHEIISESIDATIINDKFDFGELSPEDQARYSGAMLRLTRALPVTKGMPLDFEDREDVAPAFKELLTIRNARQAKDGANARLTRQDIEQVSQATSTAQKNVIKLAASMNAQYKVLGYPRGAADFLLRYAKSIASESSETPDVPISADYIARFFREYHIVGVRGGIDSATLGKHITAVSLFDLPKVNTSEYYATESKLSAEKFSMIGGTAAKYFEGLPGEMPLLLATLLDAHAKPEKIIDSAKQVAGFASIFEADAGNWEGYTLEQHTETVLRNFDENFADKLPVSLLAPMRMAIVAHDIGKPLAAANNEKHAQKTYNLAKAQEYFDELNLDPKLSRFILTMIGDGMEYATESAVFGNDGRLGDFRLMAKHAISDFTGEPVTESMVDGYLDMCEMLVTCDGGAYTNMAVTSKKGSGQYRNAGSFNNSFTNPVGPGRRDLALRHAGIARRSRN